MIQYAPRSDFIPFHYRTQRYAVLVCHRRAGKTVSCINDLIKRCLECTRPAPRYAYIAPFRQQAKAVAWDYLKKYASEIPGATFNESELRVDLPGNRRITLFGGDNYDALRGIYLDGAVLDEADDMDPKAYREVIRPALADRLGWVVFIGTLKGRLGLWKTYTDHLNDAEWYTLNLKASLSAIIPQAELDGARKAMGEQAFMREFENEPNAGDNAIYGPQMFAARKEGRLRDFAAATDAPAFTFWDVGQSDFTALWLVQFIGRDICLLDAYCKSHEIPAHYAAKVKLWEEQYGVKVNQNYLPHDANALGASGKTYVTYLREAGINNIKVVPRTPDVWLGINELRALFNRLYFHVTNLSRPWQRGDRTYPSAIDSIELYQCKENVQGGAIHEEPIHNEFSHMSDALRTMAEAYRLGMIEGTSFVAKQSRQGQGPITPLRGPRDDSYSVRERRTINVLR